MSRTTKKSKWHFSKSGRWSGEKQNLRDNLRPRIKNRGYYKSSNGSHLQAHNIIRKLFSDGKSLEYIHKRLVDRHRCSPYEARRLIGELDPPRRKYGEQNFFKASITGLVCISEDGYAISAATAGLEPAFLIEIDLPIYYWYDYETNQTTKKVWENNYWGPGPIVYSEGKLYKFVQDVIYGITKEEEVNGVVDKKLRAWPNEKITSIIVEIVDLHIESGMESCDFVVTGWKNLHYNINITESK